MKELFKNCDQNLLNIVRNKIANCQTFPSSDKNTDLAINKEPEWPSSPPQELEGGECNSVFNDSACV